MIVSGFGLGFALYLLWIAKDLYFLVDEGHVAVLTAFGAARREGEALKTFGPGLHRKLPWEKVHHVSLRERSVDLTGDDAQSVMAEDGTVLRLDASLRFVPTIEALEAWLFGTRARMEHITGLITCILRNEIANFRAVPAADAAEAAEDLGTYALIRRDRQRLTSGLREAAARKRLDGYGIRFDAVDLLDVHPPDELAEALNAVINAQVEAETIHFRAESECAQQIIAAEEGISIAKARAAAEETELATLGAQLSSLSREGVLDDYVKRRRAEVLSDARTVFVNSEARRT